MANQLNCLRCGTRMRFIRREKFQLGQTGWVLGDLPNLFAGAMEIEIYVCPKCGKLEFFQPGSDKFAGTADEAKTGSGYLPPDAPRGRKNCVDLGYCTREQLKVPRGERYELCRSVHAEANAIISAQRRDMVGATIYLVGRDARSGELLHDATSCPMCRRMIINAGIDEVVIRRTEEEFDIVPVQKWIDEDDSL